MEEARQHSAVTSVVGHPTSVSFIDRRITLKADSKRSVFYDFVGLDRDCYLSVTLMPMTSAGPFNGLYRQLDGASIQLLEIGIPEEEFEAIRTAVSSSINVADQIWAEVVFDVSPNGGGAKCEEWNVSNVAQISLGRNK